MNYRHPKGCLFCYLFMANAVHEILQRVFDNTNDWLKVSLATALSQSLDSILTYPRGSNYQELSASGLVLTGAGKLTGIFVPVASGSPTIEVWDNTSAATTVLIDTFTPVAGTMYTFPSVRVGTGIYVSIGGTVKCTVFFDPTTT